MCNFEEGFCDLMQSKETLSEWTRTTEVQGLDHDHTNRSGQIPAVWDTRHPLFVLYFSVHIPTSFSAPSAYFLSLLPVAGSRTTADLNSPVFLSTQTCQVTHSSDWPHLAQRKTSINTITMILSILHLHSKDEFLSLCWRKTWRSSGPGSDSGSEHSGVETLQTTTAGNLAPCSDSVYQRSQFSGLHIHSSS